MRTPARTPRSDRDQPWLRPPGRAVRPPVSMVTVALPKNERRYNSSRRNEPVAVRAPASANGVRPQASGASHGPGCRAFVLDVDKSLSSPHFLAKVDISILRTCEVCQIWYIAISAQINGAKALADSRLR
jgi:hypothetical protein